MEMKRSHWVAQVYFYEGGQMPWCELCRTVAEKPYPHCPHCGAEMMKSPKGNVLVGLCKRRGVFENGRRVAIVDEVVRCVEYVENEVECLPF